MVTERGAWTIDQIVDEFQRLECDQLVADLIELRARLREESIREICGGLSVFLSCSYPMEGILHLRELNERLLAYSDHSQMRVSVWSEVLKFESQRQRRAIRRALREMGIDIVGKRDNEILIFWVDAYANSEWANLCPITIPAQEEPPPTPKKKGEKAMNPNGV